MRTLEKLAVTVTTGALALGFALSLSGTAGASSGAAISGTVTAMPAKFAKNVAVYLENAPKQHGQNLSVTVTNKGMEFRPHVAVITVGGTVTFKNDDGVTHNVFSPDHEKFDIGNLAPGASKTHTFTKPGVYSLLCNIHPDMLGYLVVIPSTYFAVTGRDGKYSIPNVPPGHYTLVAWSEKLPQVTQNVTVGGGGATANITMHR